MTAIYDKKEMYYMSFKLENGWYDILKWVTMILIPALTTAYVGLAAVWGWPYATEVAKTSAVVCTLLGSILGISTAEYNKEKRDKEEIKED